jgi:hypothetical protein
MGRAVEAAAAPGTPIAVTTGANPKHGRATAMTMVRRRLGVVRVTSDKDRMNTAGMAITIRAGPSATATVKSAIPRRVTPSPGTFACPVDRSGSLFGTAIVSTPYAGPSPARSRPLVPFEWAPVVISETTTIALDSATGELREAASRMHCGLHGGWNRCTQCPLCVPVWHYWPL